MDENHESQRDIVPYQTVKGKNGLKQTVQKILRRPTPQAITKTPQAIEKTPKEQTPEEMSVERAREILEYIVNIPESGLDAHERHLTPQEQLKRFGGIHYADIKKAFGVYADHLLTTHGAKKPHEAYKHRLLKEDLPGPPQTTYAGLQSRYYDLNLSVFLGGLHLTLYDGKRHQSPFDRQSRRVESKIPLVDVKPDRYEENTRFYNTLSPNDPNPNTRIPEEVTLSRLRMYADTKLKFDPEEFHGQYKGLHRGMRWTAANLLHWDEDKIIYPDDLDKPPFDKGQAQLSKPKSALPPKQ